MFEIRRKGGHEYIDEGKLEGVPLLLLHGLFGTASNFDELTGQFGKSRRVIMPVLPIMTMPLLELSLGGLVKYVVRFMDEMGLERVHLLGNSLGGHLAILFTLDHPEKVESLILTGSSGLYESAFGTSFPRREDYEYIKKKIELTFYDPQLATKEMVDEVYGIVNDKMKGLRIVKTAKSAIRHNVENRLGEIGCRALLVWGLQDTITPALVGRQFLELIKGSRLEFIDKCGHAPMLERPEEFNRILEEFLVEVEDGEDLRDLVDDLEGYGE